LVTVLADAVQVVATPAYRAPGCEGPFHRSAIIVRASDRATILGDLRGRRCAVNQRTSNTGMNLLRAEVSALAGGRPFFAEVIETGAHAGSVAAVAEGRADVAAIDAVTFELLQRHRPWLTKTVRRLAWTKRSPGLPYITGAGRAGGLAALWPLVFAELMDDPALQPVLKALLIEQFTPARPKCYRAVQRLENSAARNGYPILH
jgi:ABC-type phosphate/phosphonate transport system substrate-binding protein